MEPQKLSERLVYGNVKESILQIHTTELGIFLDPLTNLLKALHAKLVLLDRLVELFKVQDWSELARAMSLGHSKVRRHKLALNRGYRSNGFLGEKVSSLLSQYFKGRTRDFWIPRPGPLGGNKLEGYLVPFGHNVQNPIVATNFLPISNTTPEPAAQWQFVQSRNTTHDKLQRS